MITRLGLMLLGAMLMSSCGSDDSNQLISRVDIASQEIESVAIDGSDEILEVGISRQLQLLASTATSSVATNVSNLAEWTSSNSQVATVSETGLVNGVGDGTVSITGVYGPFSQTLDLVASSAALQEIVVVASATQINECTTLQLEARGQFEGEQATRRQTDLVAWDVIGGQEFASFFSADDDGFLRVNGAGNVTVSATRNGIAGQQALSVLDTLTSI